MQIDQPSQTIAQGSRAATVYHALLDRMRRGELKSGTRLREEDVAKALGVSRTPVREALGRLQARGLIEPAQGGMAVAELRRPRVMELYALRAILEGAAARFAAENAAATDLDLIQLTAQRFEDSGNDPAARATMNIVFHCAIYDAAHNSYLARMLDDHNDSLALLPNTTFAVGGRNQAANLEHQAILRAISERDPDKAEKAARFHIHNALQARLTLLL